MREQLKNEFPSAIRTKAFADADEEILETGNYTKIPRLKVMHNIRAEVGILIIQI